VQLAAGKRAEASGDAVDVRVGHTVTREGGRFDLENVARVEKLASGAQRPRPRTKCFGICVGSPVHDDALSGGPSFGQSSGRP